jgi:hypothetical protein
MLVPDVIIRSFKDEILVKGKMINGLIEIDISPEIADLSGKKI